ncbi:MAG: chemosensory pili system protein ChpA (sensor histidine kinase/response regulator), partial [Bacteroidia bacterium]
MTERRDYVGLDRVAGEIAESLQAAQDALQAFIGEPNDSTRLHFCLAHIHQVQGSLQMVEFFGAALLAEEMEALVNAVLDSEIADSHLPEALLALKRSLSEMQRYLEKLRESRSEFPSELVLAFNELRAVRGRNMLAAADLFTPDVAAGTHTSESPVSLSDQEFLEVAKKLRQMYQVALLGYFRGHDSRKNLNYMAKVCARAAKICRGYQVQDLWVVCIALLEGLLNNSIHSGFAVRSMLRRVDQEIRLFVDAGPAVLQRPLPEALLCDMLFYVATSNANSNYIRDVKARYKTAEALPSYSDESQSNVAMSKVREALALELIFLANATARGDFGEALRQRLLDAHHAVAILGLAGEYQALGGILERLDKASGGAASPEAELRQLADTLREALPANVAKPMFNDSEEAQQQLDRAYLSVILESRNGLELAEEAVVNFVANQWHVDYLKELPELLLSIQGSLVIAELNRAARILKSCERFVSEQLLDDPHTPDWQTLDALADSLTSVDYYLERGASDFENLDHDVLLVAERCVAQLGYPVDGVARPEVDAQNPVEAPVSIEADVDEVDPELVEIFVEEAGELLDTLNEYRPALNSDLSDAKALAGMRRGFHTLKGSGRMVGALQIGELGWSLESMLNRVVDQQLDMDQQRLELIDQCIALLPGMIKA